MIHWIVGGFIDYSGAVEEGLYYCIECGTKAQRHGTELIAEFDEYIPLAMGDGAATVDGLFPPIGGGVFNKDRPEHAQLEVSYAWPRRGDPSREVCMIRSGLASRI